MYTNELKLVIQEETLTGVTPSSFNPVIDFSNGAIDMSHTASGSIVFTPNQTNPVKNSSTYLRLYLNGHSVTFAAPFKKFSASDDEFSTEAVVHTIDFWYDGFDYWYEFHHEVASNNNPEAITPDAPTNGVVDDALKTFGWTDNPAYTSNSQKEFTQNGGASYVTVTSNPMPVNAPKSAGSVGVRIKAIGGNNPSATLFNTAPYTAAVVSEGTPIGVLMTEASHAGTVTMSNNIWSGTGSGNWDDRVLFNEFLAANGDGLVYVKNGGANSGFGYVLFGFFESAFLAAYSSFPIGLYLSNDQLYAINAGAVSPLNLNFGIGNIYIGIRARNRSTTPIFEAVYTRDPSTPAADWTSVHTFAGISKNKYYIVSNLNKSGTTTEGNLNSPRIYVPTA